MQSEPQDQQDGLVALGPCGLPWRVGRQVLADNAPAVSGQVPPELLDWASAIAASAAAGPEPIQIPSAAQGGRPTNSPPTAVEKPSTPPVRTSPTVLTLEAAQLLEPDRQADRGSEVARKRRTCRPKRGS